MTHPQQAAQGEHEPLSSRGRGLEAVREDLEPEVGGADDAIAVQMGFMRRFDPGYRAAHELVASRKLGEVTLVTGHTHDIVPPPESYIPRSGGVFKDMLIHDIDAVRFVTGAEPVEVTATGSNRPWKPLLVTMTWPPSPSSRTWTTGPWPSCRVRGRTRWATTCAWRFSAPRTASQSV
jgi:Oxidoreductase family, C-terminal alpha/beta domain